MFSMAMDRNLTRARITAAFVVALVAAAFMAGYGTPANGYTHKPAAKPETPAPAAPAPQARTGVPGLPRLPGIGGGAGGHFHHGP